MLTIYLSNLLSRFVCCLPQSFSFQTCYQIIFYHIVFLQKYLSNLTVVIMKHADEGRLEIVKTIHVICRRKTKGSNSDQT